MCKASRSYTHTLNIGQINVKYKIARASVDFIYQYKKKKTQ